MTPDEVRELEAQHQIFLQTEIEEEEDQSLKQDK